MKPAGGEEADSAQKAQDSVIRGVAGGAGKAAGRPVDGDNSTTDRPLRFARCQPERL